LEGLIDNYKMRSYGKQERIVHTWFILISLYFFCVCLDIEMNEQEKEGNNDKIGKVEPKPSSSTGAWELRSLHHVPSNMPSHVPDELNDLYGCDVFLPPLYFKKN
jgi:hypothetical protein